MKMKTISLLLILTLCLSLFPVGALAFTAEDSFEAGASEEIDTLVETDEEDADTSVDITNGEDDEEEITDSADSDIVELESELYIKDENAAEPGVEEDISSEIIEEEEYLEETGADIADQTIDDLDGCATVVYADVSGSSEEVVVTVVTEDAVEETVEASEEPIVEMSEDSEDVSADDTVEEESNEVILLGQTLTATANGITVTASGSLPEGATASITPVSYDDSEMEVLLAVDITIYEADGAEFEPENDTIAVTIQSDAIDGNNEVYHITENGEAEKVSSDASDGSVAFEADHFSVYVVTSTDADAGTSSVEITGTYYQEEARSMLSLINEFRTGDDAWYWDETDTEKVYATGLSELTYDYDLEQIAMQRAAELAISYSHTRPDGSSCFTVEYNGVRSSGENIFYPGFSASALFAFTVFQETDQSYSGQGHRRLMLSSSVASVGIACIEINGCYYWVMEFGRSSYNTTSTGNLDGSHDVTTTVTNEYLDSQTHNFVSTVVKAATCTEEGQEKLVCSDCNYTKYATIAATGHSYDSGVVTTEPTCSTEGVMTYTCTKCGVTYTESIAATGIHTYDAGAVTKVATCSEEGEIIYTCTVCGVTKTEVVPTTAHTYDAGTVTTAATCTENGVMTFTCSVCGNIKTEVIPATRHNYDDGAVTTAATCTEDGVKTYTCSTCGDAKIEVIPAAHTWDEGAITTEATCTEDGVITYTCTVCGETKTEVIEATGHSYDNGVVTTATTSTTSGLKTYTCSKCGATYTETIPATGANDSVTKSPQTGDTTNVMLYVILVAACGCGLAAVLIIKKRKVN